MAKNSATESMLGELHAAVARVMSNAVRQIEKEQEKYETNAAMAKDLGMEAEDGGLLPPDVPPALLSVITKFLNENKITCVPEEGNAIGELDRILAEKKARRQKKAVAVGNVVHLHDEEDE